MHTFLLEQTSAYVKAAPNPLWKAAVAQQAACVERDHALREPPESVSNAKVILAATSEHDDSVEPLVSCFRLCLDTPPTQRRSATASARVATLPS